MSIRYKLMSTFSLFSILTGLFIFFFFPYQQKRQILNQAMENSITIARMTADNLATSLVFEDKSTAEEVLNILKENENFVFALVKSVEGKPFVSLNQDGAPQLELREKVVTPICKIVDNITITSIPIISQGIKIGSLVLGLSIEKIKAEIDRRTNIAMLGISFLMLVTILTSMFIANVISKPIHKVIEVSSNIAQGDFNSELKITSRDEVGKLASAFNEMSIKLKESIGELERSKKRYRDLIESANVGIMVAEDGKITQVNKKAEKIFGYSREELIGQSPSIITPEEYSKKHKRLLSEILKSKKEGKMIFEEEGIRKDGSYFPVEISFTVTLEDKVRIIAVISDLTEKKEMEYKLLQAEKLKSLGELAGGVAHDFNNILAAILGRAQLLQMYIDQPAGKQEKRKSVMEMKKGLDIIEKAAQDGAETVRRIQEFSRKRTDDRYFTQVNINELIEHVLEFTRVRWKDEAESKGIKIQVKKGFSPLPLITGSASELREVFTNLINNAIDALPQGGQIKVKTFKRDSYIFIKMEDNGIGILKEMKDRIFDPFFTSKGPQSTGLGLSVSYGIINRHRGTITVDTAKDKGTAFTISLPISEENKKKERRKSLKKKTDKVQNPDY